LKLSSVEIRFTYYQSLCTAFFVVKKERGKVRTLYFILCDRNVPLLSRSFENCAMNVLDAVAVVECGPLGCGPMWSRVDGWAQVYLGSHLLVC
jgi:hypothetical protein